VICPFRELTDRTHRQAEIERSALKSRAYRLHYMRYLGNAFIVKRSEPQGESLFSTRTQWAHGLDRGWQQVGM
jgi:hypothetical protein